ncbi:MAG: hypothetical protein FRX49_12160 [Trebouxia sp. A1-2]|nr:MAG: hypothetical protein FRX49_12160 [Trebouxia sp. A1-2]
MPSTDVLKQFGLSRNPFTDRTAEKTFHDGSSLYVHSDLQGFHPSAYDEYNDHARSSGKSRGHFVVDLCRPGHLTICLRNFQERIKCNDDNWDAQFGEYWTSADIVDCIVSYTVTQLMDIMTDANSKDGAEMLARVKADARASQQFLLLTHLYSQKADAAALARLRKELLRPKYTAMELALGSIVGVSAVGGAAAATRNQEVADTLATPFNVAWSEVDRVAPAVTSHPRITIATTAVAVAGGFAYYSRYAKQRALQRADGLKANVRVVKQQPTPVLALLLQSLFSTQDQVDTIRSICIGISAHQKLELLSSLVKLLGYESLAVFGDCFDEVVLLDPVQYPGAMKAFAREVCRNDLLNFGRLHFFFPDSRMSLDLNTDKTLKEARFDRHFVRDLTWSRHQLEELAERRFVAAQRAALRTNTSASADGYTDPPSSDALGASFTDLFKKVSVADFSGYLSRLSTPRELMIMMTEMFARIEAKPNDQLKAEDMEFAVSKALEQAV